MLAPPCETRGTPQKTEKNATYLGFPFNQHSKVYPQETPGQLFLVRNCQLPSRSRSTVCPPRCTRRKMIDRWIDPFEPSLWTDPGPFCGCEMFSIASTGASVKSSLNQREDPHTDGCEIHFAPPANTWFMIRFPCKCQQTILSNGFEVVRNGFQISQASTVVVCLGRTCCMMFPRVGL